MSWLLRWTVVTNALCASAFGTDLEMQPIGAYHTGVFGNGATEIVTFHAPSQCIFSVNGNDQSVDLIDLHNATQPRRIAQVSLSSYGSVPTSICCRDDIIATCLLGTTPQERGQVVFLRPDGTILGSVQVGWHPDMLQFSPDGQYLVVANEGEPSADGQHDGEGSVSIISIPKEVQPGLTNVRVRDANFLAWDERDLPTGARKVERLKRASEDFEPEGIAISQDSQTAYISLQENNAIAVVDLAAAQVESIFGLGYKDHSKPGNELDPVGLCEPGHLRCCPTQGMYQPDNVAYFRALGREFLILANEGDTRMNETFQEELPLSEATLDPVRFPHADQLKADAELSSIVVSRSGDTDGDGDLDELYTFGGRSITIITTQGELIYDSGSQIERTIASRIERQAKGDAESRYRMRKGPEPEGIAIAELDGHTFAFVGLERDNSIMAFDVSDPSAVKLSAYVHPSDFVGHGVDLAGDIGPEGIVVVPAETSPTHEPLLIVANEVSGSITIYAIRTVQRRPHIATTGG